MEVELVLKILVLVVGFYMAWNIGANDVSNAMGTSVGSGALTLFRAVILAAILEFCGAFFAKMVAVTPGLPDGRGRRSSACGWLVGPHANGRLLLRKTKAQLFFKRAQRGDQLRALQPGTKTCRILIRKFGVIGLAV